MPVIDRFAHPRSTLMNVSPTDLERGIGEHAAFTTAVIA